MQKERIKLEESKGESERVKEEYVQQPVRVREEESHPETPRKGERDPACVQGRKWRRGEERGGERCSAGCREERNKREARRGPRERDRRE